MEQVLANRSVSITELKRSPSAVLAQANSEPVAVLNHNKPAAYLLPAEFYAALIARVDANDLREAIDASRRDSRPAIPAEQVFTELDECIKQVAEQSGE